MTPFLFLYCKLVFGLRIENRKALRALPGGYFLYGNHTNTLADAFIPTLLAFPRRANIITSADTVSIPGVRNIVQMLARSRWQIPSRARGSFLPPCTAGSNAVRP